MKTRQTHLLTDWASRFEDEPELRSFGQQPNISETAAAVEFIPAGHCFAANSVYIHIFITLY